MWTRRSFTGLIGTALTFMALPKVSSLRRAAAVSAAEARSKIEDFAFLHLSDTHLTSRPSGQAFDDDGRSIETLRWWAQLATKPVGADGKPGADDDPTARSPRFAIHTGDVFEYSVVDDCWQDWQRLAAAAAGCPVYCVSGNHDNTWGSINHHLRRSVGGDNYSRDEAGVHFVFLNSAGPLHPLPCWDQRVLEWLKHDLQDVAPTTPVVLAMHHPLSGEAGYASAYDKLRLWEVVRRHRVAMILDGHWHRVEAGLWQNIPRVNGGETFRTNPGFATVRVTDGILHHRYHFHDSAEGGARSIATLTHPIDRPAPRYQADMTTTINRGPEPSLALRGVVTTEGNVSVSQPPALDAWIDDRTDQPASIQPVVQTNTDAPGAWRFETSLALPEELPPGRHYVTLRMVSPTDTRELQTEARGVSAPIANRQAVEFEIADPACTVTRFANPAGIRSPLRLVETPDRALIIFGDTAGRVVALDRHTLEPAWSVETGSEIVAAVSVFEDRVIIGDGDGRLHVIASEHGRVLGRFEAQAPIYGPAVTVGDCLYFGDAHGIVYAFEVAAMRPRWTRDVADFGIESAPAYDPLTDRLIIGAWDGRYHALDRETGRLAWSTWSPRNQAEKQSRYYGPADVTPVIQGSMFWGTDRGYRLGRYRCEDGQYLGDLAENVSAVGDVPADSETPGILARTLDNRLIRYDRDGHAVWETAVALGRSPKPPAVCEWRNPDGSEERFAAVSDTGLFTLIDGGTGRVLHKHAVTPGLFVHAPIAVDPTRRRWFVAGMDGSVTALRFDA